MKFKKWLSLALCACLVGSMLAGCGGGTASSTATAASGSAGAAASDENMTISVIGVDWGFGPLANSEMEQHWEKMLDADLDIQWVSWEDYPQKVNTLISTNTQPDVVQCFKIDSTYYYPIFTQAIEAGNFVDLTKYLKDDGLIANNAVMKNWDESMWDQATYNGGIYMLPRSKAEIAQFSGINVRRDLMKKYGFEEEPKTMDELKTWLIDLSKAATEGEGQNIYGLEFYGEDFMHDRVKGFATAFTGQMDWGIDANGEFSYMQFNDKYLDFLNWVKDLYEAGAIDPEFALGNADTSKWKSGKSAAVLTQWYNWNQSEDRTTNKIFDDSLADTLEAWCLMPVEGPASKVVSPNAYDIDQAIAISSSCSEEKIQKILKVFNSTEETVPGYDSVMMDGVEGLHYTLEADGTKSKDETQDQKRTEGYVGGWNQIFLKTDADQIAAKFQKDGAAAASEEAVTRAKEIRADIVSYLETSGLKHENTNLYSETYANNWSTLVADVNSTCVLYVMGQIDEQAWKDFVKGIVDSADYKAIQAEFKAAAAGK